MSASSLRPGSRCDPAVTPAGRVRAALDRLYRSGRSLAAILGQDEHKV
jgi:hypothetical protein